MSSKACSYVLETDHLFGEVSFFPPGDELKPNCVQAQQGRAGFADNLMSYLILWPPEEEWKWHELQVYAEFTCWLGCGLDRVPSFYSALMFFGLFLNSLGRKNSQILSHSMDQ